MYTECVERPALKETLGKCYNTRLERINSLKVIDYNINYMNDF